MRKDWSHLEGDRVRGGGIIYRSEVGDDFGCFRHLLPTGVTLVIIATAGDPETEGTGDWEHVSVHAHQPKLDGSIEQRPPTWDEMCHVKSLFWEPHECVVQYHPPQESYVNTHDHVLHLWAPKKTTIPQPPMICV
jgi:hypothetical protein